MIFFLHGDDRDGVRAKSRELLESLQKKKPDAEVFKITPERWNLRELEEFTAGRGLFEHRYLVFADRLFENKEAKEGILERLEVIAESPNIFIFLEGKVDKVLLSKIEKVAEKMQAFELPEGRKQKDFAISDAFGERDRKKLWVLYQKAMMQDASAEKIHGTLFWQLKCMLLAGEAKTAGEAGLNPFVFSKSKRFTNNYEPAELKVISSKLVSMYHNAHRGFHDFEIALERFILTL